MRVCVHVCVPVDAVSAKEKEEEKEDKEAQ